MPRPILPDLPPINDAIRTFLIARGDGAPFDRTMHYIETGEIKISDLTNASPARIQALKAEYEKWLNQPEPPDPKEQQEWNEIRAMFDDPSRSGVLKARLEKYVTTYDSSRPAGNHVDEAKAKISEINKKAERDEWDMVDKFDYGALVRYYRAHPNTSFFRELDDCLWSLVTTDSNVTTVSRFINDVPSSSHKAEAMGIINAFADWDRIKRQHDIFLLAKYMKDHPGSPFTGEANLELASLKDAEIHEMKTQPRYDKDRLDRLMKEEIFSRDELIWEGVVSEDSLRTLMNLEQIKAELPLLDYTKSATECPPNATDVYFFGVPSTGKTCIIMGLLGSDKFIPDYRAFGGEYASDLNEYKEAGITPGSTQGDFVTLVKGSISDSEDETVTHPVNVIDMSGEEFAFRISKNEEAELSFDEMGTGATNLLRNDNRKIFFLIVDPTTDVIKFNRVIQGFDMAGNTTSSIRTVRVNQTSILKGFISLFEQPENRRIMEKVDAIHIIVSKADTLDANKGESRSAQAKMIVTSQFTQELKKLRRLCAEKNLAINSTTNFLPQLYTFSVGHFYVGDIFDYNSADADKLITAIEGFSYGLRDRDFFDKIRDILNTKIF